MRFGQTSDRKILTVFDSPRSRKSVRWMLFGACLVLGLVDFFVPKHGQFSWEEIPNFFAAFGFLSCVFLVFIAKGLRKILKRGEAYYDR